MKVYNNLSLKIDLVSSIFVVTLSGFLGYVSVNQGSILTGMLSFVFALFVFWKYLIVSVLLIFRGGYTDSLLQINSAQLVIDKTNSGVIISSSYRRVRTVLLCLIIMIFCSTALLFLFRIFSEESYFSWVFIFLFSIISLLLTVAAISFYYEFLPSVVIDEDYIYYQMLDFKRLSLFSRIKMKSVKSINVGKFNGYTYHRNNTSSTTYFEPMYYYKLFVVTKGGEKEEILSFESENQNLIHNEVWEKDMKSFYSQLKKDIPLLKLNLTNKDLFNPFPKKGNEGWSNGGKIK